MSGDNAAVAKREAWATRPDTDVYVSKMGGYALERDSAIIGRMLRQGERGLLLDLPCGTGRYFKLAEEAGFRIIGADYSPTMLQEARANRSVSLARSDAFRPPFARDSFDVILVSRLLFHYERPEDVIAALLPCVKPGGRMIFDTLNPFSARRLASILLFPIYGKASRRLYFQDPAGLRLTLEGLKTTVLEQESIYLLPTRLYRYLPRALYPVLESIERLLPVRWRVLTYWHLRRD